jgi:Alpha/beta hydrolase family
MMPSLSIWLPLVRRDPGARFSQSRNVRVRSKPETRRNEAMKTINMLVLAVFATLLASALAVATEHRDDSGKPKTGGTTEKKQGYAAVNGLKLYYEIHGTGKPLVVLHGAFGWATVQPTLAKDRQVIAVELQGHGHTADIDRPLTYEQMADDTAALLKELKIEQADFFGYSMGAMWPWLSRSGIPSSCEKWPSMVPITAGSKMRTIRKHLSSLRPCHPTSRRQS